MINFSLIIEFLQKCKKKGYQLLKAFKRDSGSHYKIFQRIQLSFIYFFALVVLMYSIVNSLGFFPEVLLDFFPIFEKILSFQFLKILATPEKTFILYLLVLEILINRTFFNFSILVKFNVLLIFILEMVQNLLSSYWDLIFSREFDNFDSESVFFKYLLIVFYSIFFLSFFILYLYCYIQSLKGLFPVLPSFLQPVVDSVGFWLQIKITKDGKGKRTRRI
jgi:hypothetical protein